MCRKNIDAKDVKSIMVGMLVTEAELLLSCTFAGPLQWHRKVLTKSGEGYPLNSVGACSLDRQMAFLIPMFIIEILCLIYSL